MFLTQGDSMTLPGARSQSWFETGLHSSEAALGSVGLRLKPERETC
jgi:hypothetical protein